MIDSDNLRTASLYINNQLLSRGLIHDSQPIDFADPEADDGGLQATMGRVMGVVNDLILRRDRDAEHRESLSTALRSLRAESQRQTTEYERQGEKLADAQRAQSLAEGSERSLRSQLRAAETSAHKLQGELAKLRTLVAQTRAACATETRRRDRQIDALKKAVADAGRTRGKGAGRDVISICVTGAEGGGGGGDDAGGPGQPPGATEREGYSLRFETNSFLTALARGLSEENDSLLALLRRTLAGLREMSGQQPQPHQEPQATDSQQPPQEDIGAAGSLNLVQKPPQETADELAHELEKTVDHLRDILSNPSFVPIEEVEVREHAIARLRAGLETMEARWRDAVGMIEGWRRRMVASGRAVDVEDLQQMSFRLSPVREEAAANGEGLSCVAEEEEEEGEVDMVDGPEQQYEPEHQYKQEHAPAEHRPPSPAESLHLVPAPGYELNAALEDSDASSIFQDDVEEEEDYDDEEDLEAEEPNIQIHHHSSVDSSSPLPPPPQLSPLKDSFSSGNRGSKTTNAGDYATSVEEDMWDIAGAAGDEDEEEEQQQQRRRQRQEDVDSKPPAPPPHGNKPRYVKPPALKLSPPPPADGSRQSSACSSTYDSPLFGKSGERPSQSAPGTKLFSSAKKPSASANATLAAPPPQSPQHHRHQHQRHTRTRSSPSNTAATTANTNNPTNKDVEDKEAKQEPLAQTEANSKDKAPRVLSPIRTAAPPHPHPLQQQPPTPTSRLPRPQQLGAGGGTQQGQSPMLTTATIAAKLAAAEREADAARVRAKLRAVRKGGGADRVVAQSSVTNEQEGEPDVDPVKKDRDPPPSLRVTGTESTTTTTAAAGNENQNQEPPPTPGRSRPRRSARRSGGGAGAGAAGAEESSSSSSRKSPAKSNEDKSEEERKEESQQQRSPPTTTTTTRRKREHRRTSKAASRRRSTLSPWELQSLIQGTAGVAER
ncbi:Afadin and alpha-actinin-binding-domain-containing protein [Xylariomycetidae sp. FL0641]|nr:Afadin and alpha-actinin-binding-domain-containing protein [Xylariomycetidae sp. FL0641]